ncbi:MULTISPECIES: S-layer homology domain-containing protein, partial [unclassified Neglectibacter]|uniref:S-layer homology domain-containing protein n=1 Tax=unclassified Neglectibacter TaxID=2632164 RepID=UPI0013683A2F
MNKSKFLKKSLAAVLAVLMIVAMIPLSAAAASAPKVYLDSQQIDFAGGASQSVTVDNNTPKLTWDSQAKTKLVAVNAKGDEDEVDDTAGIANLPLADYPVADDVYTVTLRLYEESEEGGWQENPAEYTLLVTVKEADVDLDATIKEVTGIPEMVSYSITDDKITIIVAFDEDVPTAIASPLSTHATASAIFVPSSKKVDGTNGTVTYAVSPSKKVTVTAPNAEKVYDVEIKNQTGFATFSVPDQIGDAEIKDKVTNSGDPTVKVKVKKGTNFDKIVPTFTLGETVEKVTTYKGATANGSGSSVDNDEIDVVSGKTELKFDNSGSAKTFNVYLKGVTTPVKVKVTVEETDEAEGAELKSIQVGEKARATVTGKDVTVNMGVNTDYSVNVDIVVEASKGATVSIPSQNVTLTQNANVDTIFETTGKPVNISGKKFTIRVVSEDEKTTNDYNITLVSASEVKTDLTDFSIKDTNDGKIYSATFNGLTGTINLPFSMKGGVTNGSGWTIYATPSAGATAFTNENPAKAIVNGTTTFDKLLVNGAAADTANGGFVEYYNVRVAADDLALGDTDTTRTYTIKLVFAQPKTGNLLLSGTAAVGTNNLSEVTENNTFKTEIGKVNTDDGEKDAVKLTLPHSVVEGMGATPTPVPAKIFFKTLKVSPEARVFGFAGGTANTTKVLANEIKQLDEKVLGPQGGINKIEFDADAYGAYNTTNKELTVAEAYTLYVVNEKTPIDANTDIAALNTAVTNKNAKVYYVYAVKADPEKSSALTSIKSVVDTNVTAKLSGGKITITVPASYALADGDSYSSTTHANITFTLNFAMSKLASMTDSTAGTPVALLSDNGKTKDDGTKLYVQLEADGTPKLHFAADDAEVTGNWVVTSEDGANSTKYPVSVKVAPAETGATIKSLKVGNSSASISGSTINLSLPFGTALNPIKLDITADKMAKVFINGNPYKATNNYSLNSDVTITVTSEDGKTTNVYTLKTTLGERFTDVPANAWFAEYVEKAVDAGIVLGQGNGTFNPYGNITREDFAMMTVRMLGVEVDENATVPFKDEASVS